MIDFTSLTAIIIAVVVICFIIKFIVSPIIKAVLGVITFLVLIYILQKYLGFNLDQILAPFGISLNSKLRLNFNSILGPINYCADQIKSFLHLSL